jgi:hypothetical protein
MISVLAVIASDVDLPGTQVAEQLDALGNSVLEEVQG